MGVHAVQKRGEGSFWKSSELKSFQMQGKREKGSRKGRGANILIYMGSREMLNGNEIKDQVHYFIIKANKRRTFEQFQLLVE